jgi:hypothetical protein
LCCPNSGAEQKTTRDLGGIDEDSSTPKIKLPIGVLEA